MSPTRTGLRPTSAINCSTGVLRPAPEQVRHFATDQRVGEHLEAERVEGADEAGTGGGLHVRVGMVQPLAADVVRRVDHDAPVQRWAVLGEQLRHGGARHRQQHDVRARDRIGDRHRPRRLR